MTNELTSTGALWATALLASISMLNAWTSRFNQFFFFSRTVWEGFRQTAEARQIELNYRLRAWLALVPAYLLFSLLVTQAHLAVIAALLVSGMTQSGLCMTAFALAHRATGARLAKLPAPDYAQQAEQDPVTVVLRADGNLTARGATLLALAPVSMAAAYGGAMVALHMGLNQLNDAIVAQKADFLQGLGLGLELASLMMIVLLRYFSRNRTAMGRFTVRGMLQLAWAGAVLFVLSVAAVPFHILMGRTARVVVVGGVMAYAILRVLYMYSRARMFPPARIERNGDQYWYLGMFYCNPNDPTLFIQHRCGPGFTVNFANFLSWPLTVSARPTPWLTVAMSPG